MALADSRRMTPAEICTALFFAVLGLGLAGWAPRVLFHVPAAAVCWGTYETCKRLFRDGE